jgi:hypothetical protein
MFMDATVWWDLDDSISEQQTTAMLRTIMDANVGWVLDVSLFEQQKLVLHIYV